LLFGDPPAAVDVKQGSSLFHLLEHIQDEVHRFAITFHRQKRSGGQTRSALDEIPGIGPKTKKELLKKFKSVKRLRAATVDEIQTVVGPSKAKKLVEYFSQQDSGMNQDMPAE